MDAVQKKTEQRLKDLQELKRQMNSGTFPNISKRTLKVGDWGVEFKFDSSDGNKTGTVTALFKTPIKTETIAKTTYGGGRGQYNNMANAAFAAMDKLEMRIDKEIAFFKKPISSFFD